MIEVTDLMKTFHAPGGDVHALNKITFTVKTGQFVSIIGKSGSGKSTLCSTWRTRSTDKRGTIMVDGQDIAKLSGHKQTVYRSKKIGFVFQQYNLIPNLTAHENHRVGARVRWCISKQAQDRSTQTA